MSKKFPSGVITGNLVKEMFDYAKFYEFALPAVNVFSSSNINATLETASEMKAPVIIQFSIGGAEFYAGKSLKNNNQKLAILGAIAGAKHVHEVANFYNIPVILHTDHCSKKHLFWIDGLLDASIIFFKKTGKTLFSSHMIDLSQELFEENLKISSKYFKKMKEFEITLEIELGVTGGEEDGIDHSNIEKSKLYTQPKEVAKTYKILSDINKNFIIAAAFGNVHGVYKSGNIKLNPKILYNSQNYIKKKYKTQNKPVNFVFHGGSGSKIEDIQEAISYGVVKMNIDTDLQFAYTEGARDYLINNQDYLLKQIGNPQGKDIPNKKIYDPRVWLRESEITFKSRLKKAFQDLNNVNRI